MTNYVHKSKYFYGNIISEYGLKNGYVDYRTLAKSFDAVLCNDITKLFNTTVDGKYCEVELENGCDVTCYDEDYNEVEPNSDNECYCEPVEIFQYYIVDNNGYEILTELTNEIVYYLPLLDVYVWGVTHYGTSWDYVLTDIKIDLSEDNKK